MNRKLQIALGGLVLYGVTIGSQNGEVTQAHADNIGTIPAQESPIPGSASSGVTLAQQGDEGLAANDFDRAESFYQHALEAARQANPESADVARLLVKLGNVYEYQQDYARAVPLYQQALAIAQKTLGPENNEVAYILTEQARLASLNGDRSGAERLYRQALAMRERLLKPDDPYVATSLDLLGKFYDQTGEYAKAAPLLQRAVTIRERSQGINHPDLAFSLRWLGQLYSDMHDYPRAETAMRRALAIYERQPQQDWRSIGILHSALGYMYYYQNAATNSEAHYRQALNIFTRLYGENNIDVAMIYQGLGELYRKNFRDYPRAEQMLARSQTIRERILGADHPMLAENFLQLGDLERDLGHNEQARGYYQKALPILAAMREPENVWRAEDGLSAVLSHLKQTDAAIEYGKMAVDTIEKLRGDIHRLDPAAEKSFIKDKENAYRHLAELLISQGRQAEAQHVIDLLKQQEFSDFTRQQLAPAGQLLSPDEQSIATGLNQSGPDIIQIQNEIDQLQKAGRMAGSSSRLQQLIAQRDSIVNQFRNRFDDLVSKAAQNGAQMASVRLAQLRSWQSDLAAMGHGAAMIYYLVGDQKLSILLTTPQLMKTYTVNVKANNLEEQVRAARQMLRNRKQNPNQQLLALYRVLFPEALASDLRQLHAHTLMLSLDGILRYLPFAALYDGQHYLVENYALAMLTSTADHMVHINSATDDRAAAMGVARSVRGLEPLTHVPNELKSIVKTQNSPNGVVPGEILLDAQFNESALRSALQEGYPLVHIASHFNFNPGYNDNSYLVLGDGSKLTLADIRQQHLDFSHVDLLTLSACETAMGSEANGREIEGLGRETQDQGAHAVFASLWPVDDVSTPMLMLALYHSRMVQHETKADALRQAQISLIRGGHFVSPFYWAPFILMGNWL